MMPSEAIAAMDARAVCVPASAREVSSICWDSRQAVDGTAYFAIVGEKSDGNDFVSAAIAKGAALAVCTRPPAEPTIKGAQGHGCALATVDDPLEALSKLAAANRAAIGAAVVGVTGSSGKTTTKDLVASVLSRRFKTVATAANRNNELGVPATVLEAGEDTEALVVEMGMRGLGQIERLCRFVRPDIAVITNIGVSHMELLGSRDNIARAKGEIIAALPEGGTAVIPGADDYRGYLEDLARGHGCRVLTFGFDEGFDVHAASLSIDARALPSFWLVLPGGSAQVSLSLPGEHVVLDALAAAAAAHALGMDAATIAEGLSGARFSSMRLETAQAPSGLLVINDAYNANPESMRAAFEVLASMEVPGIKAAVLGDMGELGEGSQEYHRLVGSYAAASGISLLVCVGSLARGIARGAIDAGMDGRGIFYADSPAQAADIASSRLGNGDIVLVKASHSMGLEETAERLVDAK